VCDTHTEREKGVGGERGRKKERKKERKMKNEPQPLKTNML
jgi:hypothetical protein